ncbi:hypothetical protein NDN08_005672 [Rhodosorus marinus]|uniref:Uncharacterized protein n=1 Tax=Rhodosorus marinus TaxID=101924 RepID=A0AAV8V4J3_9RHOD|nr:hypothetical protein NDN08_005672 [Rhodosorus marinus]
MDTVLPMTDYFAIGTFLGDSTDSRALCNEKIKDRARRNGFDIVIRSSDPFVMHYTCATKRRDGKEEQELQFSETSTRKKVKRKRVSRRVTQCPFSVTAKKIVKAHLDDLDKFCMSKRRENLLKIFHGRIPSKEELREGWYIAASHSVHMGHERSYSPTLRSTGYEAFEEDALDAYARDYATRSDYYFRNSTTSERTSLLNELSRREVLRTKKNSVISEKRAEPEPGTENRARVADLLNYPTIQHTANSELGSLATVEGPQRTPRKVRSQRERGQRNDPALDRDESR